MADTLQQKLIAIAKAEVGYHEGRSGGHWNNREKYAAEVPGMAWVSTTGSPWCDLWVHWLFWKAGALNLLADVGPGAPGGSASCDVSRNAWRKAGRYSEFPAIGAQAFYGTPSDSNHTGFVVDFDDTYIWAVEGNTNDNGSREGDGVYLKKRLRRSANVLGYGYPAYPGGIKSADPAWASGFKPGTDDGNHGIALRVDAGDISHHNSKVTAAGLKTAKDNGLRVVWHKATQGTDFIDERYAKVRPWARAAGLRWGGYPFLEPVDIVKQVEHFLKHATPKEGDARPWLDFEDEPKKDVFASWSAERRTNWIGPGVELLKKELGVYPFIYTRFAMTSTLNCMLVAPRYNNTNKPPSHADGTLAQPWKEPRIRQFSDGIYGVPHTFPGLGAVDLDHFVREGPQDSISWFLIPAKDDHKPPPPPPPPPAPTGHETTLTLVGEPKVLEKRSSDHQAVVWTVRLSSGKTVRMGHANLQGTDPIGTTRKYVDWLLPQADAWVFNEVSSFELQKYVYNVSTQRPDGTTLGWGRYMHGFSVAAKKKVDSAAVALLWNTDVLQRVTTSFEVLGRGVFSIEPTRVLPRALLEVVETSERLWRQGSHTEQHVDVGGKARIRGALTGQNQRAKHSFAAIAADCDQATSQAIHVVTASASRRGGAFSAERYETYPLFGSADLNVDYDADRAHSIKGDGTKWFPYTVIGGVADVIRPNTHGPTHGNRLIDWGWIKQAQEAA